MDALEKLAFKGHTENLHASRRMVDLAADQLRQVINNLEVDSRLDAIARDQIMDHLREAVKASQSASSALFNEHGRVHRRWSEMENSDQGAE